MTDVSRMRVSDAEREDVVAQLQFATIEGRLSLDELGDRLSVAYAAVTRLELDQLIEDLPPLPEAEEPPPPPPSSEIISGALAFLVLAMGIGAVPLSFSTPWGPVLGAFGVLLGVYTLSSRRDASPVSRGVALAGTGIGAVPAVFFLTLLLTLS